MHGKSNVTGWIVGLVASAISIDLLASKLPRLLPYIVVLTVIFVIVRLVLYHTRH